MKIEHIGMWCVDLEKIASFYETYFNAVRSARYENPVKGFSSYFLRFTNGTRLEIMHTSGVCTKENENPLCLTGFAHIAFSVGSEESVDVLTSRLEEDGYTIAGRPRRTGDGYYESVVLDPEGNSLEITI